MDYPKHEEFLKKYISVSADFIDKFNQTRKIKDSSKASLGVKEYHSNVSINVGSGTANSNNSEGSVVEQLKSLKDLLDSGVITKEEFETQKAILERAEGKVKQLEQKITELQTSYKL